MATKSTTTLVAPDGREYSTTDRTEVTNLRARGYKVKAEPKSSGGSKSTDKPSK